MRIPRFRDFSTLKTAIAGIGAMAVAIAAAFAIPTLPFVAGSTYAADFTEAGGMGVGDQVLVAGIAVGTVTDMELVGDKVHVKFTAKGITLGNETTAAIKTATLLGKRYLGLTPAGTTPMEGGDLIPTSRTTAPYNLSDTLNTFTQQAQDFDKPKIEAALNAFSDAFTDTPDNLKATLTNVKALSQTISSRDSALRELLQHAAAVSGVLSDRTAQFQSLVVDGNELLRELQTRKQALDDLIEQLTYLTDQASSFVDENGETLGPVLDDLNSVLDTVQSNDASLSLALQRVAAFVAGLGEGIATGPRFNADIYLGTQIFNYTDVLRAATDPQPPRLPGTPGLPVVGPLPNPLAAPPSGTGADGPNPQPSNSAVSPPLPILGGN